MSIVLFLFSCHFRYDIQIWISFLDTSRICNTIQRVVYVRICIYSRIKTEWTWFTRYVTKRCIIILCNQVESLSRYWSESYSGIGISIAVLVEPIVSNIWIASDWILAKVWRKISRTIINKWQLIRWHLCRQHLSWRYCPGGNWST